MAIQDFPSLTGVTHRFFDLPGLRMHVAEAGSGDPVLLLHGFPQNWWEWRWVMPELAKHYRVICPDMRGAGWTDAPAEGYSKAPLTADVVALLDELDLGRVHLIAHDWGALVGYNLCFQHPDRVRSFLSLATPHPYIRFTPRVLTVMWRLWFQLVIVTPYLGPRLLGRGRQPLARWLLESFAVNPEAWTAEDIELFVSRLRDPHRARSAASLYRGLILPEAVRIMSGRYRGTRLTTPTVALFGDDDAGLAADMLGGFESHVDDFALELVPGAGHYLADDRPEIVSTRALDLFART